MNWTCRKHDVVFIIIRLGLIEIRISKDIEIIVEQS